MGGRKGGADDLCAALPGAMIGTRACGNDTATIRRGTPSTALHTDRQWQPPWQQSPWPNGDAGACFALSGCIGMPSQCFAGACDAVAGIAVMSIASDICSGPANAPVASAVHASSAIPSTARKLRECGRSQRRIRGA